MAEVVCQKNERSHLNQSRVKCGSIEIRNGGPKGISSSIRLGLPGLRQKSLSKALGERVDPIVGNEPSSVSNGISRSPMSPLLAQ